jgi:uncharacterized protein (TIGR02246 family)
MPHLVTTPEAFPSAFDAALNAGDLEGLIGLYDPDATLRMQSGEVHSGMAAVAAEMGGLIAARAHIDNTLRHTLRHGDTALIIVDYVLRLDGPGGERVEVSGTATNVIQRHADGSWRLVIANPQGVR